MMAGLRRMASGFGAKIFFGLLVLSFAVWGIADVFAVRSPDTVLTAGEASVSIQEYALASSRARGPIEEQLRRRLTAQETEIFGIDQAVLSQLTASAVVEAQADEMGLGLSEAQLAREIAADPSFRDSTGNFSRAAFSRILANAGISERAYVESQERAQVRRQVIEAVTEGIALPAVVRDALGNYSGERRTVEFVRLPPSLVEPVPAPDEAALAAYFEENKQAYAAPEFRAVDYAVLTPEAIADPEAVTPEAIEADYNSQVGRFGTPERRRVQQIILTDEAAASAAKTKLDAGTPFAQVASEAGPSAATNDLGLVGKSEILDPAVAEAAFALPLGGVSPVVKGRFGAVIVSVSEIEAETKRPLAEVSDEIRNELALAAAAEEASNAYQAFEDARAGGATLAEAASSAGLTLQSIRQVDSDGNGADGQPIPDFPGRQELVEQAFQTEEGLDNVPIDLGQSRTIFYEVTAVEPARERALEEVRERVVADWTAAERTRLLDERAAALKTEAQEGKPLADIAADIGGTVETAPSITRQSGTAELGEGATSAAFSGGQGLVATAADSDGAGRILMRVTEVAPPADPAASASAASLSQTATAMENDVFSSYVAELQGLYPVRVYPEAIENAKALTR